MTGLLGPVVLSEEVRDRLELLYWDLVFAVPFTRPTRVIASILDDAQTDDRNARRGFRY